MVYRPAVYRLAWEGRRGSKTLEGTGAVHSWSWAIRQVLVAEGLSIAMMETAEVLVEVYTPGVMQAGLSSPIFWGGMLLALTAGFLAAWPVNYWLVGKGIRHIH